MSLMKMDVDHEEYDNVRQPSSQAILEDSSSSYFGDVSVLFIFRLLSFYSGAIRMFEFYSLNQ